jgi:hypothetical protein
MEEVAARQRDVGGVESDALGCVARSRPGLRTEARGRSALGADASAGAGDNSACAGERPDKRREDRRRRRAGVAAGRRACPAGAPRTLAERFDVS